MVVAAAHDVLLDTLRYVTLILGALCLGFMLATMRLYHARQGKMGSYIRWMGAFGILAVLGLSAAVLHHVGEDTLAWGATPIALASFITLLVAMARLVSYYKGRK